MVGITCCKDCQDRHVGCHGTCSEYIAFKTERDQELERINKQKADGVMNSLYIAEAKKRMKTRRRTRRD